MSNALQLAMGSIGVKGSSSTLRLVMTEKKMWNEFKVEQEKLKESKNKETQENKDEQG